MILYIVSSSHSSAEIAEIVETHGILKIWWIWNNLFICQCSFVFKILIVTTGFVLNSQFRRRLNSTCHRVQWQCGAGDGRWGHVCVSWSWFWAAAGLLPALSPLCPRCSPHQHPTSQLQVQIQACRWCVLRSLLSIIYPHQLCKVIFMNFWTVIKG